MAILPFTTVQAEITGGLRRSTAVLGLSLGDRACLALGIDTESTVYTADRVWRQVVLDDVDIGTIR